MGSVMMMVMMVLLWAVEMLPKLHAEIGDNIIIVNSILSISHRGYLTSGRIKPPESGDRWPRVVVITDNNVSFISGAPNLIVLLPGYQSLSVTPNKTALVTITLVFAVVCHVSHGTMYHVTILWQLTDYDCHNVIRMWLSTVVSWYQVSLQLAIGHCV